MANFVYPNFKEAMLGGNADLTANVCRVYLIDTADYSANTSAHVFATDVPTASRVASATLTSRTVGSGIFDAGDALFSSASGDQSEALIIVQNGGSPSTSDGASRLVCMIDVATGLPVTPNGGDITVTWDSGANKIFAV